MGGKENGLHRFLWTIRDHAAGLPIGIDGEFYVGSTGDFGQEEDDSILEYNYPPESQPGLWCQWVPSEDGDWLEWDGGEKFYYYVEWLEYLIDRFFKPWGYVLNGDVEWQREDRGDMGVIEVKDNEITVKIGRIVYGKGD